MNQIPAEDFTPLYFRAEWECLNAPAILFLFGNISDCNECLTDHLTPLKERQLQFHYGQ